MLVCCLVLARQEIVDGSLGLYSALLGLQLAGYFFGSRVHRPGPATSTFGIHRLLFSADQRRCCLRILLLLSGRTIGVWKPQR